MAKKGDSEQDRGDGAVSGRIRRGNAEEQGRREPQKSKRGGQSTNQSDNSEQQALAHEHG